MQTQTLRQQADGHEDERCSGSCYSEFEEGRACSRHGRPAPRDFSALEQQLLNRLAQVRAPRKAILVTGGDDVAAAKQLDLAGVARFNPAPIYPGQQAGYLIPIRDGAR